MSDDCLTSGFTRRDWLRLGALTPLGLTVDHLAAATERPGRKNAERCLLIFMDGGPSHIDLWDVKPKAPANIRGEFGVIQTSNPELPFSELLPGLSKHAHRFAVVRSVTHAINDHNAGSYYALTGRYPVESGQLVVNSGPENFPPVGAVLAKLRPSQGAMPDFLHIAEKQFNNGSDLPGQTAGFLGAAYDPFVTGDPSLPGYSPPGFAPLAQSSQSRLQQRHELMQRISTTHAVDTTAMQRMSLFQQQAVDLLASPAVRTAFDLSREPASTRMKYGLDPGSDRSIEARKFGGLPHLGQSALLARRMLEAGVKLVTLMTGRRIDQAWDTHRDHFKLMRRALGPPFDRAVSALLDDLAERGLLDDTLVVIMGEFGRTPKVGMITSSAGAAADGRDHWPYCYSVLMAGAGIQAGALYGASDRDGGYPLRDAVSPADVTATIYAALGIDPHTEIHDRQGRPYVVCSGRPIEPVLA